MYIYLGLKQGQQSTANQCLAIKRRTKMVGIVATGWDISHPEERAEGVLLSVRLLFDFNMNMAEYLHRQDCMSQGSLCNTVSFARKRYGI